MKTQILLFFISMLSITAIHAGNPIATTEKTKSLVIETALWKSDQISVQIKEATGVVILDETVKNSKGLRKYNLKNLPDGQYTLEVSNALKITTQDFTIESNSVQLSDVINTVYKPVIIWNESKLDINLLTLGNKALINIIDKDNNIVFAENLETPAVHKRYDLSGLADGEYTVTVAMNGRSFVSTNRK